MKWFGRPDREYREELEAHIQIEERENLERGMSPSEARQAALRKFGNALAVRDNLSESRPFHFWQTLHRDMLYSIRVLKRSPGLTATVVLTLAVCIGANAAIFSVVNAVLLRSLPFPQPEQLVLLWGTGLALGQRSQVSFTDMADWRHESKSLEEIVAFQGWWNPTLNWDNRPEHVAAMQVSDGYFRVMRGAPLLGRVFLPEDQVEGHSRVVILTYSLWHDHFQADPQIVGKTIQLDSVPHIIVGVMPAGFHSLPPSLLTRSPQLYVPLAEAYDNTQRSFTHLRAIGRLKPGASPEQAQAELSVIADRQARANPDSNASRGVHIVPLQADVLRNIRPAVLVLQCAVLAVLLIACANLANLALARSGARQKEIALRAALGASRFRLLGQLLMESTLLSIAGGTLGLLLAYWGVTLLRKAGSSMLLDFPAISIDWSVLLATGGIVILTSLIFGAAPALSLSSTSADECLKSGTRSAGSASRSKMRRLLIVAEVALSAVLLVGSGLLLRSFVTILEVNPGFDARNVFTAEIGLPEAKYPQRRDAVAFFIRLIARLKALPGVESASAVSVLPESGKANHTGVRIAGRVDPPGQELAPDVARITPDYFRTLRIPLLAGRAFTEQDDGAHDLVAVINQTLARNLWPNQNAVGQKIWTGSGRTWRTVVGVVDDTYQYSRDSPKTMQLYVPHADNGGASMTVLVRTMRSPDDIAQDIRTAVSQTDPEQAVFDAATMESVVGNTVATRRFTLFITLSFAAAALLLAGIGLYGVVAYGVAEKTREFGVRVALGAKRWDVLRLVLVEGTQLVVVGLAAGLIAALALTRFLSSLLFGVKPSDVGTFCGVGLLLLTVALVASFIPARRATRIDPAVALRYE
ncbi:MAG TPA: ABC transporter permease [Bryobacteraceae bacterium]|nr:ABC transporter permease [Bryobacteraceae bacterium]